MLKKLIMLNFWRLFNAKTNSFYEVEIVEDSVGFWVETPKSSYHSKTYEKALDNAFSILGILADKGYKKVQHMFSEYQPLYEYRYDLYLKEHDI